MIMECRYASGVCRQYLCDPLSHAEKKDYGAYQISEVAAMPELDIRMEGKKAVISKTSIEKSNGGCYTVNVILK